MAAVSAVHSRDTEVDTDVPDGCGSSSSKVSHTGDEDDIEKVGNSIFYVDNQLESPCDEDRGQLNVLSAAYEV